MVVYSILFASKVNIFNWYIETYIFTFDKLLAVPIILELYIFCEVMSKSLLFLEFIAEL